MTKLVNNEDFYAPVQCKFYDAINGEILGGILLEDGSIVCGCCGGHLEKNDIYDSKEEALDNEGYWLMKIYKNSWVDISKDIIGDDGIDYGKDGE